MALYMVCLEQALRSKLSEIERLRLMPRMFALRAVQRHTAASRSIRPLRREQQGVTSGWPKVTLSNPFSTLAHTPSLSASRGHKPPEGLGLGFGLGSGLGLGLGCDWNSGLGLGLGWGWVLDLVLVLDQGLNHYHNRMQKQVR